MYIGGRILSGAATFARVGHRMSVFPVLILLRAARQFHGQQLFTQHFDLTFDPRGHVGEFFRHPSALAGDRLVQIFFQQFFLGLLD